MFGRAGVPSILKFLKKVHEQQQKLSVHGSWGKTFLHSLYKTWGVLVPVFEGAGLRAYITETSESSD